MTPRRPEYTRPYSAEYLRETGVPVTRLMVTPFVEMVDANYVQWLERKLLAKERER